LTLDWARRSKRARDQIGDQALFGIVQGGMYSDLRVRAARDLVDIGFDGYALGGLALGEPKVERDRVVRDTLPHLPEDRIRYLMGVGYPEDIVDAVAEGADLFDCVLPTRNARTGTVFTRRGKLTVKNAEYARDERPIDPDCTCYTCRNFSRAYLRHLFNVGELLAPRLLTLHSLHFFMTFMRDLRRSIREGFFAEWAREFRETYRLGG
jgi:queuine tRNA-ribosyltransferase